MSASGHCVVGVIGGMGPEATVDLMRRVIARTPARDDQDHVHLIVDSNPKIPSRIAHLIDGTGEDPSAELARIAGNLEAAGATVLAMPCNTAHAYAAAIRAAVAIPFLDMVALTVEHAATLVPHGRVGLLASTAVHKIGLYAQVCAPRGLVLRRPARQDELMALIVGVKRGDTGTAPRARLASIAVEVARDADILVIACTELSVIASQLPTAVPVVDSLDVLADAIVATATATAG